MIIYVLIVQDVLAFRNRQTEGKRHLPAERPIE